MLAGMPPSLDLVNRLLFPTPKSSYDMEHFPEELMWVPRSLDPDNAPPEECIPCLLLTSPAARFTVLYLHSNAEDLGRCYSFCSALRSQFQVHVVAVEYPGYGICPGSATEESVTENAFVAFNFIRQVLKWPLDEIIVLGRSIGCGPALAIASRYRLYGLILVCPFLSVRELCREFLGSVADVITERFPNQSRMTRVTSSLLIVHGKNDTMVPWTHGRALYDACKTRKRFVAPEDMTHNSNLYTNPNFFVLPMLQFFGLPDYNFDEIKVPEWVWDKRRCHLYQEYPQVPLGMIGSDGCDGACLQPFMPTPRGRQRAEQANAHGSAGATHVLTVVTPSSSSRPTSPTSGGLPPDEEPVALIASRRIRPTSPRAAAAATLVAFDARSRVGVTCPLHTQPTCPLRTQPQLPGSHVESIDKYLQMTGGKDSDEDVFDLDMFVAEEEQSLGWPARLKRPELEEDLPAPPADTGFLKVPRSTGSGPGFVYRPSENTGTGVKYLASCVQVIKAFSGEHGDWWAPSRAELARRPTRATGRSSSPHTGPIGLGLSRGRGGLATPRPGDSSPSPDPSRLIKI